MNRFRMFFAQTSNQPYVRGEQAISYKWTGRASLRNNRLQFKTVGKLPITLEEFIEYSPI